MSRQFRYRVTALALGALIFGAPLMMNGTASAEQLDEGGRQVTFGGGGFVALNCRSHPDVESMVVPPDSMVRVVNRTGYSAQLQLSGDTKGTLPDDAATDVVFRRGTTAVTLKPNCPLGEDVSPLMVTASPSASAAMPDPTPVPSGGDSSAPAAASSDSSDASSGAVTNSTLSDPASTAARPGGSTKSGHRGVRRPGQRTSAVTPAAQGMPHGGGTARIKTKTVAGTPGSPDPAFAGMPPGDQKTLVTDVPQLDLEPVTQQAVPAAVSPPSTEIAAAEPVAATVPMRQSTPIGLLGLIAAVCVMGVGAAAIRAIVSQRANRANMA
ncbi:hypothetical protein [Paractinoplanes durhamensis]|uniref:Uncharacterized protein n=1 Tax=Paractinoplanes durhamensis TaxID=113563 RepID=A0ABQ3Z6A1_9ACTN|nr:hypothetical protein [Actinoplanes durhamensis]GIE05357.1 hypothetical protein Adu01nite_67070 [Actinoplanes durhamensis]